MRKSITCLLVSVASCLPELWSPFLLGMYILSGAGAWRLAPRVPSTGRISQSHQRIRARSRVNGLSMGDDAAEDEVSINWDALQSRISALQAVDSASWRRLQIEGTAPSARYFPSLTPLEGTEDRLILFGGIEVKSGLMRDDTWLLELAPSDGNMPRWTRLNPGGKLPPGRAYHDAVFVGGRCLVVHGGLLQNGCRWHDTWRLDLNSENLEWEFLGDPFAESRRPVPRYHHSLVASDSGEIVLYGGHDFQRKALNDVWRINASNVYKDPEYITWQKETSSVIGPAARAYHAAAMIGNWMLISGGELQDGSSCGEMWVFDLDIAQWRLVDKELAQEGRMRHAMCCIKTTESAGGVVALSGGHGQDVNDGRPTKTLLLKLGNARGSVLGVQAKALEREGDEAFSYEGFELPAESMEAPEGLRREAALMRLDTGQLVLFGGNNGQLKDSFGDGYHQYNLAEAWVADAPPEGVSVGAWRRIPIKGAEDISPGCAVAALKKSGQVLVTDFDAKGDRKIRVRCVSFSQQSK